MLADGEHVDGREYPGLLAYLLERRTQGQAVDDSGQHAHLVALDPVDSLGRSAQSAEYVAAADDDTDFDTHPGNLFDLRRILGHPFFVDAVLFFTHERFAAQFQEYSFVTIAHNHSVFVSFIGFQK